MIASARPEELSGAGDALAAAAPKILAIARDLRHYISRVQWEGEGGEAFRKWGADMVSETLVLGDFTEVVSQEMLRAGQALREAKAAVPKPAGQCFADPEKEKARIAEEKGPKLQEAIHQLERLSSYYDNTQERMRAQRQPEFKPLVDGIGGGEVERPYDMGSGTGVASSATSSRTASGGAGAEYSTVQASSSTAPAGRAAAPDQAAVRPGPPPVLPPEGTVGTNLDSVSTLPPETVTRPAPQTTNVPPTTGPGTAAPLLPPIAPVVGPQQGRTARMPSAPGPGPVGGPGSARGPLGTPGPLGVARPGSQDGIVGGKPMPGRSGPTTGGPRMPMGTVIGEERGAYGRGTPGMPGYGGMPGAPGAATGTGAGRRLATQPGGSVGTPAASGASGRTFTPGGTGLVRPPVTTASGQEERRQTAARPDYLAEDEETWSMGQRKIVPPVID
ncbi:hypothetical protein [Streptomyces sp. CB03234]|uniref:hypothetical protein n=1 Tax=Streptomyces sp. (strain CB03234) TaxID=1703937 RepID=UPI0011801464|nr:hypothetical protein [Streptomyces sp. CB03234]